MKIFFLGILCVSISSLFAQSYEFLQADSIEVNHGGTPIVNPWSGGHNATQVSTIELNNDGKPDLFVYDRVGNTPTTYLNIGTEANPKYKHAPQYEKLFPKELRSWVLLRDYNCDGKKDIYGYASGGIQVWENVSTTSDLLFELRTPLLLSYQPPNLINLYVSSADIPSVDDIDGDGDLDVFTFGIFGNYIEYHKNLSQELYGHCDSLTYELRNLCWGNFSESASTNSVNLYDTCNQGLISNPESVLEDMQEAQVIITKEEKGAKHTGSTILSLDINDDGVRDLLLGDVSYNNLVMLENGGTTVNSNSSMNAQDLDFPSYDVSTDLRVFPSAFYEDVNSDGIKDLLVTANSSNQSEDDASIYLYKNNGTDSNPIFEKQQEDFLQDQAIEVGTGSIPTFFDHNADGLMDLLVSNFGAFDKVSDSYLPYITLYENTGTSLKAEFTLVTNDYMNLSSSGVGKNMVPAFADLDNDNDLDMIIGDYDGYLHKFTNTAGQGNTAVFVLAEPQMKDLSGVTIDIGQQAAPTFYDLDNDGDEDLIIGERNGNINYYQNNGATLNEFGLKKDTLGQIQITYFGTNTGVSAPRFIKNDIGETQLMVGGEDGVIKHYNNIDGNLLGTYNEENDTLGGIEIGVRAFPAFAHLNDDNKIDLIVGNKKGGLNLFMGTSISTNINETNKIQHNVYPNPSSAIFNVKLNEKITNFSILDLAGKLILYKEINTNQFNFNLSTYANGFYYLVLKNDINRKTVKIIKQ